MLLDEIKKAPLTDGRHLSGYIASYRIDGDCRRDYEMVSANPDLDRLGMHRPEGVTAIVLDEGRDRLLVCLEFRPCVNGWVCNLPGGLVDHGETPEQAVARELREETGLTDIRSVRPLPPAFAAPSMTDRVVQTFVVTASGSPSDSDDPKEPIRSRWMDRESVLDMLRQTFHAPDTEHPFEMSSTAQAVLLMWATKGTGDVAL